MTCSIFNLTQCILNLLPWWLPYAWWGFVAILVLGFIGWIKQSFGWIGVVALLVVGSLGGGVYIDRHYLEKPAVVVQQPPVTRHVQPVVPRTIWDDLPPKSLTGD